MWHFTCDTGLNWVKLFSQRYFCKSFVDKAITKKVKKVTTPMTQCLGCAISRYTLQRLNIQIMHNSCINYSNIVTICTENGTFALHVTCSFPEFSWSVFSLNAEKYGQEKLSVGEPYFAEL